MVLVPAPVPVWRGTRHWVPGGNGVLPRVIEAGVRTVDGILWRFVSSY